MVLLALLLLLLVCLDVIRTKPPEPAYFDSLELLSFCQLSYIVRAEIQNPGYILRPEICLMILFHWSSTTLT